jgi:hypothetical protein
MFLTSYTWLKPIETICNTMHAGDLKKSCRYHMSVVLFAGISFLWQLWCFQGLSDTWITITNWCLRRLQGVQQYSTVSYLSTWEFAKDYSDCCQWFEGYDIGGSSLRSVKSCFKRAMKGSVSLDWITLSVCSLHHQRIEDEIVRHVTRI